MINEGSFGESLNSGTYTSTKADENAIRAEGTVTASLSGVAVSKTSGAASSSDASSFYGLNAAVLAMDSAILNIAGGYSRRFKHLDSDRRQLYNRLQWRSGSCYP
ncbi:MAG: hypothetical protein VB070_06000 [Clostridiaceae bacterium]|nr:hypothetical protein [Clostridiaceae bacterium]